MLYPHLTLFNVPKTLLYSNIPNKLNDTTNKTGTLALRFQLFKGSGTFYITDVNGTVKTWQVVNWDSSNHTVNIGFFVMTGEAPYTLHNSIDTPWSVDLMLLIP